MSCLAMLSDVAWCICRFWGVWHAKIDVGLSGAVGELEVVCYSGDMVQNRME